MSIIKNISHYIVKKKKNNKKLIINISLKPKNNNHLALMNCNYHDNPVDSNSTVLFRYITYLNEWILDNNELE